MKLSCLILPIYPWKQARDIWQRVEQLGFHAAYSYDHLAYEGFQDGPWYGAIPSLAAAATVTERLRIGTMITSPNFRHPVTLAKDLISIDNISDGRLTVGIGAGSSGLDATALGQQPWTPGERANRFTEFVPLLDRLLTNDTTTFKGKFYATGDARMVGGCVQKPRVPFVIAGSGPHGMKLAAEHGQGWVTCPFLDDAATVMPFIRDQIGRLEDTCHAVGRDPSTMDKVYLTGFTPENPLSSVEGFTDLAARYADIGITELVVHWPVPDTIFDNDPGTFDKIATLAD